MHFTQQGYANSSAPATTNMPHLDASALEQDVDGVALLRSPCRPIATAELQSNLHAPSTQTRPTSSTGCQGPNVDIGYRQQIFMPRNEPEQSNDEGKNAHDAQDDRISREAEIGHTIRVFEQHITDDGNGQPSMPKPVEPNGGLES